MSRILLAAAGITAVLSATLLTAFLQYAQLLPDAGTRAAVETVPVAERSVKVVGGAAADDHAAEAQQRARYVQDAFHGGLGGMPVTISSGGYAIGQRLPDGYHSTPTRIDGTYATVAFLDGLAEHADLTEGSWPQPVPASQPAQVALPARVASLLQLRLGDEIPITDRRTNEARPVVLVGQFTARNPGEPYWQLAADPVIQGGYGPMVVHHDEFIARYLGLSTLEWVAAPTATDITHADLLAVADAVSTLRSRGIPGPDNSWYPAIQTKLDDLTQRLSTARLVTRSGLLLPALLVLVIGAYSLFLVARLLTDQRRNELALLRARGASRGQIARLAAGEALLVVVPAALVGAPLGAALLRLSDRWLGAHGMRLATFTTGGWLGSPTAWLISVAAALGCAVALVLPAARRTRSWVAEQQERSRPGRWSVVQRAGVDIALIVVAVLSWSQLRHYAGPLTRVGTGLDVDPLLIIAPVLGVLAAATVSLRLLPGATRFGVRVTQRRRSFARLLGMWHADRRPHAGPVLLLVLAVAVAGLASCVAASWQQSQRDQADHSIGADLRLDALGGGLIPPPAREFALPGVRGVMVASHRTVSVGQDTVDVLALDAEAAPGVAHIRDDLTAPDAVRRLAADRRRLPGVALPIGTHRFAGQVAFTSTGNIRGELRSGPVTAVFDDGGGVLSEVTLGTPGAGGGLDFDVPVPTTYDEHHPPGLVGLGTSAIAEESNPYYFFDGTPSAGLDATASWRLSALRVLDAAGTPTPMPELPRWASRSVAASSLLGVSVGQPVITSAAGEVRLTVHASDVHQGTTLTFSSAGFVPAGRQPIAALVTPQLLARSGGQIGSVIELRSSGAVSVPVVIRGTIEAVPSVPAELATIVDLPTLYAYQVMNDYPLDPPNQWWLATDPAQHAHVLAGLAGKSGFTVADRVVLTDQLLADPLGWGVLFALYVAVLGATVLAAFGLAVDARATSLRSSGELAVLHTLGTPPTMLARALVVEQSVLAGLGVLAGLVAGVGVAGAMAPSLILTQRGGRPVPEVLLVMPPGQLVIPAMVLFGVALGLGAVIARRARRDVAVGLLRIGADQ